MLPKIIRALLLYGVVACTIMISLNVFAGFEIDPMTIVINIVICGGGLYYYERVYLPQYNRRKEEAEELEAAEKAAKSGKKKRRSAGKPKSNPDETSK